MEQKVNFPILWKQFLNTKKTDDMIGLCKEIQNEKIDEFPEGFMRVLSNSLYEFYANCCKNDLVLIRVCEELGPVLKVFHLCYKVSLGGIDNLFFDKTKDFIRKIIICPLNEISEKEAFISILAGLLQILDIIVDYKIVTNPEERTFSFLLGVYEGILFQVFLNPDLILAFTTLFLPEDKFIVKVPGISNNSIDLLFMVLSNFRKVIECVKTVNDQSLANFLGNLLKVIIESSGFNEQDEPISTELNLKKSQLFLIVQKTMFNKNQKKDQQKIFFKFYFSQCKDLLSLNLIFAFQKMDLLPVASFKKDQSSLGAAFQSFCYIFSDNTYFDEVELLLIAVLDGVLAKIQDIQVPLKFMNYVLQLIKTYFNKLGLRSTRSMMLNSEDSGLVSILFNKHLFYCSSSEYPELSHRSIENWNKIWNLLCKNPKNFKWLSSGILSKLDLYSDDFSYIFKIKEWLTGQLMNNEKFLKEGVKNGFVEDLLRIIEKNIEKPEFHDHIQALLQVTIFILGSKELFINYNPTTITKLICDLLLKCDNIFSDSLFRCLGEVVKIVHSESHQATRLFLDQLSQPEPILKLILIISGIVRSTKTSSEVTWPLCKSGWLITLKNKIVNDLPEFEKSLQVKIWKEIFIIIKNLLFMNELSQSKVQDFEFGSVAQVLRNPKLSESREIICEDNIDLTYEILFDREAGKGSNKIRIPDVISLVFTMILYCGESEKMIRARERFQILMLSQNSLPYFGKYSCLSIALEYFTREKKGPNLDLIEKIVSCVVCYNITPQELTQILHLIQNSEGKHKLFMLQALEQAVANCLMDNEHSFYVKPSKFLYFRDKKHLALVLPSEQMPKKSEFSVFFWISFSKLKKKICVVEMQDKTLNRFKVKFDAGQIIIVYTDGKKKKFSARSEIQVTTKEWNFVGISFFNQKVVKFFRPKENFNVVFNNTWLPCKIQGSLPSSIGAFKTLILGKSLRKSRVLDGRISSFYISSTCLYQENFESLKMTFPFVLEEFKWDSNCNWMEIPNVSKVISENTLFSITPFMENIIEKGGNFTQKDCERFIGTNIFESFSDIGGVKILLTLIDPADYNETVTISVLKIVLNIIKCSQVSHLIDAEFIQFLSNIMAKMPFSESSIEYSFKIASALNYNPLLIQYLKLTQLKDLGNFFPAPEKQKFLPVFMKLIKQNFKCDKFSILLIFGFIKDLDLLSDQVASNLLGFIGTELTIEGLKGLALLVFLCTSYLSSNILIGVIQVLSTLQYKLERNSILELNFMHALQMLPMIQCRLSIIQYLLSKNSRNMEKFEQNDCEEICLGIENALIDISDGELVIKIIEILISHKNSLLKGCKKLMIDLILQKIIVNTDKLEDIFNTFLDHSHRLAQRLYKSPHFPKWLIVSYKKKPELITILKNLTISIIVLQKNTENYHKFQRLMKKLVSLGVNTLEIYQMVLNGSKSNFHNPLLFLNIATILEECLPLNLDVCKGQYKNIVKDLYCIGKSLKLLQSTEPAIPALSFSELNQKVKNPEQKTVLKEEIYLKDGGFFRILIKYVLIGISIENTSEYFDILQEVLITPSTVPLVKKFKLYSNSNSKAIIPEIYDLFIFTELIYIYYFTDDTVSLFLDFILIFIVDFSIYDKLVRLVNSLTKKEVSHFKAFMLDNPQVIYPSWQHHQDPSKRKTLKDIILGFDSILSSSMFAEADEETTFKIINGKMLEKMMSFKQSQDNSEALFTLLKSKDWIIDMHVFLTVYTSVRMNLACESSSNYRLMKDVPKESQKVYRYDSDTWLNLEQALNDWVNSVFETQNRLKNFINYKFQTFLKSRNALFNIENKETSLIKLRNCTDLEGKVMFTKKSKVQKVRKELLSSLSSPEKVRDTYFDSLQGTMEAEYEFSDVNEITDLSSSGGISRECELIKIKGSFYGKIEVDEQFLAFYSDGSLKPSTEFYIGSAPEFTKLSKTCSYIWHTSEISEIFIRRYIHRPTAFEVFLKTGKSYLINLFSSHQCKVFFQLIENWKQLGVSIYPTISEKDVLMHSALWKKGLISNFEYLMILNKFGNRSYNDISQYPIFPWVLNKYDSENIDLKDESVYRDLTLPIGALTEANRVVCKKRYDQVTPDVDMIAFHHGSHYMTGGSVSYYLLRLEPFTSQAKKIQNDTFDMPDRLFHSIQLSWESCLSNNSDVKELVPEFFTVPDFLFNLNHYPLGDTQSGKTVNDVVLPLWCNNSACNFIRTQRLALESGIVSKTLNNWIDLIFGYKQQGKPAIEALNIFSPACYLESFENIARTGDNVQGVIDEAYFFGQVPVMLFKKSHPVKEDKDKGEGWWKMWMEGIKGFEFSCVQASGNTGILGLVNAGKLMIGVKVEGALVSLVKIKGNKSIEEVNLEGVRMIDEFNWPGLGYWNSMLRPRDQSILKIGSNNFGVFLDKFFVTAMQRDGSLAINNFDGSTYKKLYLHSGLTISITTSLKYIFSSGLGNSLKAWNLEEKKSFFGHWAPVLSLQVQETLQILISLNANGILLIHDIRNEDLLRKIESNNENKIQCFASNGLGIIAVSYFGTPKVQACSLNGCEEWTVEGVYENVLCMKFDITGEILVCGTRESIVIKEVFTNRMIRKKIEYCVRDLEIFKEMNWLSFVVENDSANRIFIAFNE